MNSSTLYDPSIVDADDDDVLNEGDSLCRNLCNATFSVRICDDPGIVCFAWQPMQVFSVIMFFMMAVLGIICGLGMRSVGCVKAWQWASGIIGLVCFAIVLSYTTTSNRAAYDRHMRVQFWIGMVVTLGWAVWGVRRQWYLRRRAQWLKTAYHAAPDGDL